MLEAIFGSVIVEFFGVLTKWILYSIYGFFSGKEGKKISEIWNGRKNANHADSVLFGISNILVGYLFIAFLIGIGFLINHLFY